MIFVIAIIWGLVWMVSRTSHHNTKLRVELARATLAANRAAAPAPRRDAWTVVYRDGRATKTVAVHAPTEDEALRQFILQYQSTNIVSITQG